ncbi:MAG: HAD family hydrolase [Planctomyces sp.]|nr:HAD family hydrolase [Planctomyces sp.]
MHFLFDLDGTLTNPFQGITGCIQYALSELGHSPPPREELRWCIGPPLRSSFAEILSTNDPGHLDECLAKYRERFSTIGLYENRLIDGMVDVLNSLQGERRHLWVATSKPSVYARRIIEHFGLAPYFQSIHGSELDGTRTNKVELIAHLLRTEGISPSDAVMIGDREHDVIGAKANGLPVIGVLWGYGSHEELVASGADEICETPAELRHLLQGWIHA